MLVHSKPDVMARLSYGLVRATVGVGITSISDLIRRGASVAATAEDKGFGGNNVTFVG